MPVTPQPTKTDLQTLINQIVTGGNYTANELRPLLTNLLDGIYSPFFSASSNPGSGNNQTQTYKAGSLGRNTSTGRYFVCSAADGTTATWERLTNDIGYQQINASASTAYQISTNTSIVSFSGSQNTVTINLPTAVNSYLGKVVRIYFTSPASTSGNGVTFAVPETSPVTLLAANVYTAHAFVEFTFTASGWALTQYVPTVSSFGYQAPTITGGSSGATLTVLPDTYLVNLIAFSATTLATYIIRLPENPFLGKIVKIQTNPNAQVTALTVNRFDGTLVTTATLNVNQGIEVVFNGNSWVRVAPTI